jgi:hypothetical protein
MKRYVLTNAKGAAPYYYLGLGTSALSLETGGMSEPSSATYSRVLLQMSIADTFMQNTAQAMFPTMATSVTLRAWALYDALEGGRMLYYHEMPSEIRVGAMESIVVASGAIVVREN